MPHKLRITARWAGELVREEPFAIVLTVTNIGDRTFPRGNFKLLEIRFDLLSVSRPTEVVDELHMLRPMESTGPISVPFKVLDEGHAVFVMSIRANDGEPVEYYTRLGFPTPDPVHSEIYVRNREHVQIITLLKKLLKTARQREVKDP